ncbi:hypothetical protein M426DRAFT_318069 [Hypoxylon sp. CI-4A]|nr:hypothetical protein M426DRAFT_318069 [Hypoxylon sp. CI-4A]
MKSTFTLVALAVGLSQVTATGFGNANKFSCPDNTDNTCIPEIVSGIDWSDLDFGSFSSYKGFQWSGFSCSEKFGKRDELSGRSFQSKCITGKATSDKGSSPKISCDKSKGVSKTSITKFQVTPEFDCDLEFHYSMPDGSTCKHRSSCKSSGTTVENSQCGGATDVTVVYPKQPSKPKDSCDFGIHHIEFDCEGAKPSKSASSSYVVSTPAASTSSYAVSTPAVSSSSVVSSSYEVSSPAVSSSSVVSSSSSSAVESSSYVVSTPAVFTSSAVVSSSSAVESSSSVVVSSSSVLSTSSASVPTYATSIPVFSNSSSSTVAIGSSTTEAVTSYSVTSYLSTSTVFSTSIQTITSCGPEVTNCPAASTALTTVTIPISTTICPVTETIGSTATQPAVSSATKPAESSATKPAESSAESSVVVSSATVPVESSSTSPAGPVETLPCPNVVPSCLNTWLFSVSCKDNTDSACYCPDASFTKNIFTCLYAYGESDEVISEAISYFQGICAPFASSNPGIATGAETITTVLTATATNAPTAVTTIAVDTTVVVPCTNEAGETIPSSSSTITVSTSLTVPGVVFTTVTSGPSSTGVAVVPGTYSATVPAATPVVVTATSTPAAGGAAPYPTTGGSTTLFTSAASGTGAVYPTSVPSSIVQAGAAHVGAGMGLLGFAGMVFAAAL